LGFSLSAADVAIIVGSLVVTVWLGLRAAKQRGTSASGYFLASRTLPWWLIGPGIVATSVSSEQIVGTVGAAYKSGMAIANWEWFTLPTYTLVMVFCIPMYIRNRIGTVPEFFAKRFGPLCADIYSWVLLTAYVLVFLVTVLYGGSLAFSELTGWNFYAVLWVMTVLVGIYTAKGGLLSVMWTDAAQCVMLLGGGLLLYFVALSQIPGGWAAMAAANPDRFHLYQPPSHPVAPFPALVFLAVNIGLWYQGTNQVMIQRVLGARSTWDGVLGTIFAGFINFLRPLVTCFLGFVVYHLVHVMEAAPPLANQDSAFPFALRHLAPSWGLRGIVLAGFLAAVMSTLSSLVNSSATVFAFDVYKKRLRRGASDAEIVRAGQIAAAAALVVAAVIAPAVEHLGGIFRYFQTALTYAATPFVSVFILGLLWKRANYKGALFGIIGGSAIVAVMAVGLPWLDAALGWGLNLHWLYIGFAAQIITMVGIVLVSLRSEPPSPSQWEPFVWRTAWLRELDAEGGRKPWYRRLWVWYGIYALIWFYLYWRYW